MSKKDKIEKTCWLLFILLLVGGMNFVYAVDCLLTIFNAPFDEILVPELNISYRSVFQTLLLISCYSFGSILILMWKGMVEKD